MKKSIAICIIATLVIGLIAAIPVFAKSKPFEERAVFESDIIATRVSDYEIENGEVWIRVSGNYKVELEGVTDGDDPIDGTFDVYLTYGAHQGQSTLLGVIVIEDGEGKLGGVVDPLSLQEDADPAVAGQCIPMPVIRIFEANDGPNPPAQFCSGFLVETENL